MKFTLILATLNRTAEVEYFIKTLDQQTYRNFELIVVDQNTDDRLVEIIRSYQDRFTILHLRSAPGLSYARNVALKHISGDIVAFPDDDCAYPSALLAQVSALFVEHPEWGGLTGRSITQNGEDSGGRWSKESEKIDFFNVWNKGISYTIFLRKNVVVEVGSFDENLGVGANTPWGSAEETDYLLRAIEASCLYYTPNILVVHPTKVGQATLAQPATPKNKNYFKTYAYAMGRGWVLRKHNAPLWFVLYNWMRPLTGVTLSLLQGRLDRTQSHWQTLRGRVQGWLGWA